MPPSKTAMSMADRAKYRRLSADLAQIVVDIAGIVDPTPISDGAGAIISVARGDWLGAGLSLVSMVPYVGDLAKAGKFPRYLATLEAAIKLASESADAAKLMSPIIARIQKTLELLPETGSDDLRKLRKLVDDFLKKKSARLAANTLPDISKQFSFRTFKRNGYEYTEATGRLGVPGKVKQHRSKYAQSKVSSGTGDDAGHLIGNRFGAPGGVENLKQQNYITNQNGTFKQLENEWERKLKRGTGIEVKVVDIAKAGDPRPFARRVEWKEISPNGQAINRELTFMNSHTAKSRVAQDIPPSVLRPQSGNVIHVDFSTGQKI